MWCSDSDDVSVSACSPLRSITTGSQSASMFTSPTTPTRPWRRWRSQVRQSTCPPCVPSADRVPDDWFVFLQCDSMQISACSTRLSTNVQWPPRSPSEFLHTSSVKLSPVARTLFTVSNNHTFCLQRCRCSQFNFLQSFHAHSISGQQPRETRPCSGRKTEARGYQPGLQHAVSPAVSELDTRRHQKTDCRVFGRYLRDVWWAPCHGIRSEITL